MLVRPRPPFKSRFPQRGFPAPPTKDDPPRALVKGGRPASQSPAAGSPHPRKVPQPAEPKAGLCGAGPPEARLHARLCPPLPGSSRVASANPPSDRPRSVRPPALRPGSGRGARLPFLSPKACGPPADLPAPRLPAHPASEPQPEKHALAQILTVAATGEAPGRVFKVHVFGRARSPLIHMLSAGAL
jgi:hypothetical protein